MTEADKNTLSNNANMIRGTKNLHFFVFYETILFANLYEFFYLRFNLIISDLHCGVMSINYPVTRAVTIFVSFI